MHLKPLGSVARTANGRPSLGRRIENLELASAFCGVWGISNSHNAVYLYYTHAPCAEVIPVGFKGRLAVVGRVCVKGTVRKSGRSEPFTFQQQVLHDLHDPTGKGVTHSSKAGLRQHSSGWLLCRTFMRLPDFAPPAAHAEDSSLDCRPG